MEKNKQIMEKETYCVVVVKFDNGVKRTTDVMPKQMAIDWVHKYGGGIQNSEVFECTADGEHISKLQPQKMELGGGVEPIKNAKGEYALYPENPTKKSMGLLLEYGGTMFTSEDMSAPTIGGEMASSMRDGGNVESDWQVMFESKSGSGKIVSVIVQATNFTDAKSKGWIKSGLDKKYFAFLTTYEKKELGGNTNPKKKDNDDISQYYDMEFALGGGVPNQKQRDIITQKIGLSQDNADYLIDMSPKFAVWLADSIVKDEIRDYKLGAQTENTDAQIKQYVVNRINERLRWLSFNYGNAIRVILDWLMHPLTPKQNLRELNFQDAFEKGEEFHKELQALGGDINFVEDTENEIIKRYPPTEEGVEYYWVGIDNGYCDIESRRMGHCGRTGHSGLISLRSIKPYGKGNTINDSHVTIAYEDDDHLFYQVKGKKNQKPAEKYHPYIFDLIKTLASDPLHLFMGFGSEYASSEDYGFEDMTKEQVKELYEINPEIFSDFVGEMFLYQSGITTVKPKTNFTMEFSTDDVENLLQVDRQWRNGKIIEKILEGDDFGIEEQNWGHYYEWYADYLDYLDSESDEMIIEEISEITTHPKEKIYKIGILPYLKGEIDDFESDAFDQIIRAIANALSSAEAQEYNKHYYRQLENALNEIGTIEYLNYDGLKINVELGDLLSSKSISNGLKNLDTNDLEDVFWDATQYGQIELPRFDLDERYDATPQAKDVNRIFKDNGFYG